MKLTPKQQRFVEEYLIDLNATQASIRAGYSSKTANEIGAENLTKPSIKEAIALAMAERSRRTGISQDRVIKEYARIAFANMKDFATWNKDGVEFTDSEDLSEDDAACVAEVSETEIETDYGTKRTKRLKLYDKNSALEKVGKHLGMFKEGNVNVNIGVQIMDDIGSGKDETD